MELARDNYFKPSFISKGAINEAEISSGATIPYEAMSRLMDKLTGNKISD